LSSDPAKSKAAALELHIAPERAYGSFAEMAAGEAKRPDRIDAVSIVTPNHVHFGPAKAFLEAGIHVICDKPLTTTVEDALALAEIVRKSGLIFGLTHNYTGYPLVRQAREMIEAGEVGRIRVVQVEYAQDWLTTAVEATGQKQAVWRTDPAQSGRRDRWGYWDARLQHRVFCYGAAMRAGGGGRLDFCAGAAARRQRPTAIEV